MENNARKNKRLAGVLVVLMVMVVGLVIAVIVVNLNGIDSGNVKSEAVEEVDAEDLVDEDKSYQISLELSNIYNDGDKEEALEMYDEELSKALSEQDYGLYIDLITARSTMLILDGTCEELMAQYDNTDADVVPEEYRNNIYEIAINDSERCNDTERAAYWRGKINE